MFVCIVSFGSITKINKISKTPLHYAAMGNYFEICKLLKERGADLRIKSNASFIPQYHASKFGITKLLEPERIPSEQELYGTMEMIPEIIFKAQFDKICEEGRSSKKWLLVNIQKADDIECIKLNYLTFANEAIQNIIQSYFIFWQVTHQSLQGIKYASTYLIDKYPYIAILDPFEEKSQPSILRCWQGNFLSGIEFQAYIQDFIEEKLLEGNYL